MEDEKRNSNVAPLSSILLLTLCPLCNLRVLCVEKDYSYYPFPSAAHTKPRFMIV